jgi:hypothetical protein
VSAGDYFNISLGLLARDRRRVGRHQKPKVNGDSLMAFEIKRAERRQARLRLGLTAPSGGGKTMSALLLAAGIVEGTDGKIGLIDTERKSASLYSDVCEFDLIELSPPYSVERYQEAIDTFERAGYAVCILDQISHAWSGPGGVLEFVDTLKAQSKNAMSPWAKATPAQNGFVDRMLRSNMHIIATMRSKSEWVIEEKLIDGRKKNVPRKIGMQPVQREGIEYEFTVMLDIEVEGHTATASKDRSRLFEGQIVKLDRDWGRKLRAWLESGAPIAIDPPAAAATSGSAPATEGKKPELNGEAMLAAQGTLADFSAKFDEYAEVSQLLANLAAGIEALEKFKLLLPADEVARFCAQLTKAHFLAHFKLCPTLPDLASAFANGQAAIKKLKDVLPHDEIIKLLGDLTLAKDARKKAINAPKADPVPAAKNGAKGAQAGAR